MEGTRPEFFHDQVWHVLSTCRCPGENQSVIQTLSSVLRG